jgi:Tfp pilus assembly protein PilN
VNNQINLGQLNVSSVPFRNRTMPWVVTVIVAFISLVLLVFFIGQSRAINARAATVATEVAKLRQQEKDLKQKQATINENLSNEQKQLIVASHELVDRKYFSWSWLFEDLESVLPSDTKVTRINVRDVKQMEGRMVADLEMTLMSKSYVNVTAMIGSMDRTGVFQTELTEQNLQKGEQKDMSEYTLHIVYRPRAGVPTAPSAQPTNVVAAADSNAGGRQ